MGLDREEDGTPGQMWRKSPVGRLPSKSAEQGPKRPRPSPGLSGPWRHASSSTSPPVGKGAIRGTVYRGVQRHSSQPLPGLAPPVGRTPYTPLAERPGGGRRRKRELGRRRAYSHSTLKRRFVFVGRDISGRLASRLARSTGIPGAQKAALVVSIMRSWRSSPEFLLPQPRSSGH